MHYHLSHISSPFLLWLFWRWGWPQAGILPISASQVAKIIGLTHLCPVWKEFYYCKSILLILSKMGVRKGNSEMSSFNDRLVGWSKSCRQTNKKSVYVETFRTVNPNQSKVTITSPGSPPIPKLPC
jgi:hypothetical protein